MLFAILAACDSKKTEETATTIPPTANQTAPTAIETQAVPPSEAVVTIQNFAFNPDSLTISVGTTVRFVNEDSTTHTVTADDGAFDAGRLSNGQEFTFTFEQAGTYAYHCNIHRSMTGTIIVQ